MDLNRITREADEMIRKVVSRYNQLYNPSGSISQVELDLLLDDLRKLYDTFKQIGIINISLQSAKPASRVEMTINEPAAAADAKPAAAEPVAKTAIEPETSAPRPQQTPPAEPATAQEEKPVAAAVAENQPLSEAKAAAPAATKETLPAAGMQHATLADKFSLGNRSLSETIASAPPESVLGSRVLQPIADLTTGINLNDKYIFIKDLFNDNQLQYEEAIARVNKAVNFEEALYILQKFSTAEWDDQDEALSRIREFIKRRFV